MGDVRQAAQHMDWFQVRLNGGPPCFHIDDDGRFCGRAERWDGHGAIHRFVPLLEMVDAAREEGRRERDAAHAAQLVALREAAHLPVGTSEQAAEIVQATNHLLGILAAETSVIGTPGDHAAIERIRRAQHHATLTACQSPDAEAELAKVKEEAVRWCVVNERLRGWEVASTRYTAEGAPVRTLMESHPSETVAEYVARALAALAAGPKEG